MGRTFYRLLILLALPVAAWGQGVHYDGVAGGPRGPIANPTVTVCTSAGNGTPCTPLAATPAAGQPFTNQALTVAAVNPLPVLPVGAVSTNAGVDALGNYGFWAQPGTHVRISITGPGVATPVLQDVTIPCDATQGCTASGASSFKNINAIQFADQFTAGTLALPTIGPGLNNLSTGGSVAANTYACEVTFVGTSGETTASPASPTTTTSGATSILQCQPLDIPSGAVTYNVYWQTGGAGSFFLGHTAISLGTSDSQTTTPPTSGTTPPVSNTAVSVIAAAESALGGPGTVFIPSTLTSTAGVSGSLLSNQSMFDFRNGVISGRPTFPGNCATKSVGAPPACNAVAYDILVPVQLGNLMQVNGFSALAHAQNNATYWGSPAAVTGIVAGLFGTVRDGTRTESVWGSDIAANCSNNLGQCTGLELDIQNFSGSPTNSQNGGVGLLLLPGGNTRVFEGIRMSSASTVAQTGCPVSQSCMNIGIDIQPNTYNTNGISVGGSSASGSIGIVSFNSTSATGGAFLGQASSANQNAYIVDNAAAGQNASILFRDNGASKFQINKDTSNNLQVVDVVGGENPLQFNAGGGATIIGAGTNQPLAIRNSMMAQGATPTITGTGACATIGTKVGGNWAGSSSCTSATAASTLTIAPGMTATNGWICTVYDETTRANLFQQTSHTTTSCTLTATSVTQNDVFVFSAIGF